MADWGWDWHETDGALALKPDPAPAAAATLHALPAFVSVPAMSRAREIQAARRRRAVARRRRRLAGLVVVGVVALVTLLLTAFGSDRPRVSTLTPAPSTRLLPAGPPSPQVVALAGSLRIQLPVAQSRVTAIGYHASADGAVSLEAVGRQANAGSLTRLAHKLFGGSGQGLRYYELGGEGGSARAALDVGAAAGTDVYSPVDGTVVGLTPLIVDGRPFGAQVDVQPTDAPSLIVSLTHLRPDPALAVGASVAAGTSKLGTIVDFSRVEKQALARYTQDAGNHVELEVHEATTSLP